jgi:hypothetical protein
MACKAPLYKVESVKGMSFFIPSATVRRLPNILFRIDRNGLEWRKSVLAGMEWHGMELVGFCLIDWNDLEWRKLILA